MRGSSSSSETARARARHFREAKGSHPSNRTQHGKQPGITIKFQFAPVRCIQCIHPIPSHPSLTLLDLRLASAGIPSPGLRVARVRYIQSTISSVPVLPAYLVVQSRFALDSDSRQSEPQNRSRHATSARRRYTFLPVLDLIPPLVAQSLDELLLQLGGREQSLVRWRRRRFGRKQIAER